MRKFLLIESTASMTNDSMISYRLQASGEQWRVLHRQLRLCDEDFICWFLNKGLCK